MRALIRYRETERNWDLDLAEDVKGELESKYGRVARLKVDKMSAVSSASFW
jgi:RNA-binding protein 39